jgi:hypothetical protein
MALEPAGRKQAILDGVREHGLLEQGEELRAAMLGDLLAAASVVGDVEAPVAFTPESVAIETAGDAVHPDGPSGGEALVQRAHTEGTYVVAVSDAALYLFTTAKHHHDRVDARSGAWTREPLGQTFVAFQPGGAGDGRPGVLEVGERRFLAERGEEEAARAVASAVQQARAGS